MHTRKIRKTSIYSHIHVKGDAIPHKALLKLFLFIPVRSVYLYSFVFTQISFHSILPNIAVRSWIEVNFTSQVDNIYSKNNLSLFCLLPFIPPNIIIFSRSLSHIFHSKKPAYVWASGSRKNCERWWFSSICISLSNNNAVACHINFFTAYAPLFSLHIHTRAESFREVLVLMNFFFSCQCFYLKNIFS
jgi:hypothetical protein